MKIVYFLLIALCVIGAVGGIGYACYDGAYHIAIGVSVLAYTAWPKFKDYFAKLNL